VLCPACHAENDDDAEACFTCGKALFALTQGVLLASRYEVLRPLGKGGMGRVYKAYDRVLEETVAIKVLRSELTRDPEMARRFRSEIKLARKVSHANVCRIHDYGEDAGLLYISMEHIEGTNLKEFLSERPLSMAEAYDLVIQIARGLAAVHEHGIVHRDFKASNIMVDKKGVVKLMDFGIAKDIAADTTGVTGSGQVIGTPEYMSPEQASGGKVDLRADIYSLGCVVFEVFTGDAPFRGDTPLQTLYKHIHDLPPFAAERARAIPESLQPALAKALAKDPNDRFANVAELMDVLVAGRTALTPEEAALPLRELAPRRPPRPTTTLGAPPRRVSKSTQEPGGLRFVAGGVVATLAAVGLVLWLWSARDTGVTLPSRTASPAPASPTPATPPPAPTIARPLPASPPPSTAATQAPAARRQTPPSTQALDPQAQAPGLDPGSLTLLVVPECEVTIDGASIGLVSLKEISLSAGPHVVRLLHPDYEPLQRKLTIRPGVAQKLVLDLSEKGIRKAR
jgi:serine/threonine-protein kinase